MNALLILINVALAVVIFASPGAPGAARMAGGGAFVMAAFLLLLMDRSAAEREVRLREAAAEEAAAREAEALLAMREAQPPEPPAPADE